MNAANDGADNGAGSDGATFSEESILAHGAVLRADAALTAEHADYAFDDAAYLLDALDDDRRTGFETHLARCPLCQQAVAELGSLPGLLGTVAVDEVAEPGPGEPPAGLLPRLLDEVAAARRRRYWKTAAIGFAAACLVVLLAGVAAVSWSDSHRPHAQLMASVGPNAGSVHATITLTGPAHDPRIELDCGYDRTAGSSYPAGTAPTYRMVVFNRRGQARDLGSWTPQPGELVRISRDSPWSKQNLSRIEVSTAQGVPVLELSL